MVKEGEGGEGRIVKDGNERREEKDGERGEGKDGKREREGR
jgi:hypothetical protein